MNIRSGIFISGSIVFLCIFLMGMSGMGSVAGQTVADSPFDATIMDTAKSEVMILSATIDGKTSFNASMGKGKVQIPFENISRIDFKDESACISMKNSGDLCNLRINGISKIYGKTAFGTYQIPLKDVLWIEFTKAR
ncbi:MAG: hypothetical protein JXM72_01125 [Deltaproteobacteria bacterium]|nr:hypothetical protein [Deltaproteobacteria bacterium]